MILHQQKKEAPAYLPSYLPTYLPTYLPVARVHRPVIPGALCDTRRSSRPGRDTKTRKTTQGAADEASYSACYPSNRPSRSSPPWLWLLLWALQLSLLLWDVRKWNSALYRAHSEPPGSWARGREEDAYNRIPCTLVARNWGEQLRTRSVPSGRHCTLHFLQNLLPRAGC